MWTANLLHTQNKLVLVQCRMQWYNGGWPIASAHPDSSTREPSLPEEGGNSTRESVTCPLPLFAMVDNPYPWTVLFNHFTLYIYSATNPTQPPLLHSNIKQKTQSYIILSLSLVSLSTYSHTSGQLHPPLYSKKPYSINSATGIPSITSFT